MKRRNRDHLVAIYLNYILYPLSSDKMKTTLTVISTGHQGQTAHRSNSLHFVSSHKEVTVCGCTHALDDPGTVRQVKAKGHVVVVGRVCCVQVAGVFTVLAVLLVALVLMAAVEKPTQTDDVVDQTVRLHTN